MVVLMRSTVWVLPKFYIANAEPPLSSVKKTGSVAMRSTVPKNFNPRCEVVCTKKLE